MDKQGHFNIADSWSIEKEDDSTTAKSNNSVDSLSQLADNYIKRNVLQNKSEEDNIAISTRLQQRLVKNFNSDIYKSKALTLQTKQLTTKFQTETIQYSLRLWEMQTSAGRQVQRARRKNFLQANRQWLVWYSLLAEIL